MRILLLLVTCNGLVQAQTESMAYQALFAVASEPTAREWLMQNSFAALDAQPVYFAARRDSVVELQNNLPAEGKVALSNLLTSIKSSIKIHPTYWAYVTSVQLDHAALLATAIIVHIGESPMPLVTLTVVSPAGRTSSKTLQPVAPLHRLTLEFPYCDEAKTLCEDGVFNFSLKPE